MISAHRIHPRPSLPCSICELQSAKYRCPSCNERTCSLPCNKTHKATTGCTGIRDRVAFVSLRDFRDRDLLNDLSFLEEASRIRDRSLRDQRMHRPKSHTNRLVQACHSRQIKLCVMAFGMARRRRNRSIFDQSKSRILWTVEFVFGDERVLRHRIDENTTLHDVLEKFLGDSLARRHRFSQQSPVLLIAQSPRSIPFRRVSRDRTLREALASSTIIEFPAIHVVPDSELPQYAFVDFPHRAPNPGRVDLSFETAGSHGMQSL